MGTAQHQQEPDPGTYTMKVACMAHYKGSLLSKAVYIDTAQRRRPTAVIYTASVVSHTTCYSQLCW